MWVAPLILVVAGLNSPALPARPPDGTYHYTVTAGGLTYLSSTVEIVFGRSGAVVQEQADVPIRSTKAVATTQFDPATLREIAYQAYYNTPRGRQAISARFEGDNVLFTAAGKSVTIAKPASAQLQIIADNLIGTLVMIPAMLHATGATTVNQLFPSGTALLTRVTADSSAKRPQGVPATDAELTLSFSGLHEEYWFEPGDYVVDAIVIPEQGAEFRLVSRSKIVVPSLRGTPGPIATPVPTPAPHFRSRDIAFRSADGTRLAGTVTVPDRFNHPFAAVVLVAGSGPQDRDERIGPNPIFLQLSNALSNAGYVVLRYDKRGIGKSGGSAQTMTRSNLLSDVRGAVKFLRGYPGVDPKRIILLGHSEGGELVPTVAANDREIAGIVLMAPPALPLWQISIQQALSSTPPAQRAAAREAELKALQATRRGSPWYRTSMDVDPAVDIARVRSPILILQGGADVQVLAKDLPRLVAAARKHNAQVAVHVFRRDNHLFMNVPRGEPLTIPAALQQYLTVPGRIDPAVLSVLIGWLHEHAP